MGDDSESSLALQDGGVFIEPGRVCGTLRAPASKSHQQRLLLAASLSSARTRLQGVGRGEDVEACLGVVQALGTDPGWEGRDLILRGAAKAPLTDLDCGESGFCVRAAAALAARFAHPTTLTGRGSLARRPVEMVLGPLRQLGVRGESRDGKLPLRLQGPLRAGRAEVEGGISSQALSGLLLALPTLAGDSELRVNGLRSGAYVQLTLEVMGAFGVRAEAEPGFTRIFIPGGQTYQGGTHRVEGDWSGAAFLLVAGALAGSVRLEGLHPSSRQPDRAILAALDAAGVTPTWVDDGVEVAEVAEGHLKGFDFDATDCPDLFPPLAVLACHAAGRSRIWGLGRLRHKESDRGLSLWAELGALGARLALQGDCLEIQGGRLAGGVAEAHGDHRIAMACAVAALRSKTGVRLSGAAAVAKSYPDYFIDLGRIGVQCGR